MINYKLLTEFVTPKFTLAKGSIIHTIKSCLEDFWILELVREDGQPFWVDRINTDLKLKILKNCEPTSDLPEKNKMIEIKDKITWTALYEIAQDNVIIHAMLSLPLTREEQLMNAVYYLHQEIERCHEKLIKYEDEQGVTFLKGALKSSSETKPVTFFDFYKTLLEDGGDLKNDKL